MSNGQTKTLHHGKNVKRIREMMGIKQESLAVSLGISQQAISALEQKEALERDMLEKIAGVLKVSPEAIENFNEEAAINIIATTFNSHDNSFAHLCTFNINPVEKWMEALEENKKLYEALLKSEREKVAILEKLLNEKK